MHFAVHHIVPLLLLSLAAFAAGAINSVAGGGTLLTFPSLLAFGLSPLSANGTSTVALVPGSISACWGYRREFEKSHRLMLIMAIPSLLGGIIGAVVALHINDKAYAAVVPLLILGATVLFILNEPIGRWIRSRAQPIVPIAESDVPLELADLDEWPPDLTAPAPMNASVHEAHGLSVIGTMVFQLVVAIYGGFFGAGIGILMLATLGFLGLTNIMRMNALKNAAAVCINLIAAITFMVGHRVNWPIAIMMAVAASAGGFGSATLARSLAPHRVRQIVIAIGLSIAAAMFWKQFHGL